MRWIHKLEYKFGRYYIRNLMLFIIGGMVLVYLGDMILYTGVSPFIYFDRSAILSGQVWRVISFIFLPPGGNLLPPVAGLAAVNRAMSPLFILISIYFIYMAGKFLESQWGGFRLTLYYLIGTLMMILGGFITPLGVTTNNYLNSSLFLALATIMPDITIRLFMVIPIRGWLFLILYFANNFYTILKAFLTPVIGFQLGISSLILFALSLVTYLLFFGPTLISNVKQSITIRRNRRQWRNRNK